MKIRTGFVSNSSSSSFVLLGYVLPKNEYSIVDVVQKVFPVKLLDKVAYEEYCKDWNECTKDELSQLHYLLIDKSNIRIMSNTDDGAPDDDTIVVGRLLMSSSNDDYCLENKVEDFSDRLSEVQDIGKKLGVDNIQLVSGTFSS